ncbi:podocalyxin [Oryzias melastigma]|uniref:Podocalyxin n=1 Tax=Oryzias melastigma TaxID=30732 RepID=A0A3B3CAX5_ORYME|nr:podocalyxin [Oryzias melastigma]
MQLGTPRSRMRATPRITWPLVLSFLFHSICSGQDTTDTPLLTSAQTAVSSAAPGSTKQPSSTNATMVTQINTVTVPKLAATIAQSVTDNHEGTLRNTATTPAVTPGLTTAGVAFTQRPPTSASIQTMGSQESMTIAPSKTPTETPGVTQGFDIKTPTVIATSLSPSAKNQTVGSGVVSATTAATTPPPPPPTEAKTPSKAPPPPPPPPPTEAKTPSKAPTRPPPVTTPSIIAASPAKIEPTQTEASPTLVWTEPLLSGSPIATAPPPSQKFEFPPPSGQMLTKEQKILGEVCKRLFPDWRSGTCQFEWHQQNGQIQFEKIDISVNSSLADNYYEEITKPTDNKTLIAILASCGSLLIMIIILAVCASHHRRPYNENQQHLTEELQAVENGYHDNPTLEVMEVQPEMQEKKVTLNGEFNDSWIVPIDNLLKEEIPDEEDTHL